MKKIVVMRKEDRKFIFDKTALDLKMHPAIIEKDFWVCYFLDYLFNESKYKEFFTFKGGTSLSKAFNVISRMSEDIDIILDWRVLGLKENEPFLERSKRQQEFFNEKINELAKDFIENKLLDDLKMGLLKIEGLIIEVNREEQLINLYYPKTYEIEGVGILPCVRLEIGPLAAWSPAEIIEINPYIQGCINGLEINGTKVRTVSIERTFWEKVTILHREANRPENKKMPSRYARHYYDTYKMICSNYYNRILNNKNILYDVTNFKIKFYNDNWANYNEILNGKIRLIPPLYRMKELNNDYESMGEMFTYDIPKLTEIIKRLDKFEREININFLSKEKKETLKFYTTNDYLLINALLWEEDEITIDELIKIINDDGRSVLQEAIEMGFDVRWNCSKERGKEIYEMYVKRFPIIKDETIKNKIIERAKLDIDNMYDSLTTSNEHLTLYRNIKNRFIKEYKEGKIIDYKGFSSCSLNPHIPENSTYGSSNCTLFEIDVPIGTKMIRIDLMEDIRNEEDEIILPPMKFKITKIDREDNRIYMTCVNDC